MTDSSIFDGSTEPVVPAVTSTPAVVPTELTDLVGEGKKYSSVDAALKSIPHAQSHISTIEAENARLKSELESRRTTEDLLEDIRNGIVQPSAVSPTAPVLDQTQIESTIEALLTRKEQSRLEQLNVNAVVSEFTRVFGDRVKGEEEFIKLANETGMSIPTLNKLAATSPAAVLKLAGIGNKKEASPAKLGGTLNTENLQQGNTTDLSARVKMVGASTKDLKQAVQNAREIVLNKYK
jgi:hypothetical protein